ncbi:MAG: TolC family protein [Bacteroidetes bacterium]|nr:TolC family protein [Bacteroidota bacterium]
MPPDRTLEDHVAEALTNNAALRARRARYEAARMQAPQAAALPDLKIGFGYFAAPVETRLGPQRATLSVSQSFPWFGTLGAEEDAALARARQVYQDYADARNRLVYELRDTWYRMWVLERSIAVTGEHLRIVGTLRDLALLRYESGKSTFSDVLRLDMQREELRTTLRTLEDSREPLRQEFSRHLGSELSEPLLLPDTLVLPGDLPETDELRGHLSDRNPRLRGLEEEQVFWESKTSAARRMGYPSFTVGVTYTAIGPRDDMDLPDNGRDAILPQVGISIPLFGSRYGAMEEQARLQREAARLQRRDVEQQLHTVLSERLRDVTDAERRFGLHTRLAELAETTYGVVLKEYSAGSARIDDVLAVERDLLRYTLAREEARADLNRAYDYLMYLTAQEKE